MVLKTPHAGTAILLANQVESRTKSLEGIVVYRGMEHQESGRVFLFADPEKLGGIVEVEQGDLSFPEFNLIVKVPGMEQYGMRSAILHPTSSLVKELMANEQFVRDCLDDFGKFAYSSSSVEDRLLVYNQDLPRGSIIGSVGFALVNGEVAITTPKGFYSIEGEVSTLVEDVSDAIKFETYRDAKSVFERLKEDSSFLAHYSELTH
jgi:hypothetical protein